MSQPFIVDTGAKVPDGRRVPIGGYQPEERNTWQVLASLCQLAEEQLAVSRHILAALVNGGSVSSVEVKTSARGTDITCKAYSGSDIESAGNAAAAEYERVRSMLEARLMNGEKS